MRALLPRCIGVSGLLLLAGCSSEGSAWKDYGQLIRQAFSGGFSKSSVSREQAAAIPYASLGFRMDGGNEGILVLATDQDGEQLWTAASHIVLLLRDGRIIRTVGFPIDRADTTSLRGTSLPPVSDALKASFSSTRLVDIPKGAGYAVPLTCTTTARGTVRIVILGTSLATTQIDETCQSSKLRWSFTDNYWVDGTSGFVWRSLQHIQPSGTTLQIEILRPPG